MTVGQSALSVAEIPFVYSIVHLAVITYTGQVVLENLFIASLGAGILGTFLIIVKLPQREIDRRRRKQFDSLSHYLVKAKNPGSAIKERDQIIESSYLELSLGTTPIKFEKDKIAGTFYFAIILIVIGLFLLLQSFQDAVNIKTDLAVPLSVGIWIMLFIIVVIQVGYVKKFSQNLQLTALHLQLAVGISGRSLEPQLTDIAGRAIDLNNWPLAKVTIDRILRSRHQMS